MRGWQRPVRMTTVGRVLAFLIAWTAGTVLFGQVIVTPPSGGSGGGSWGAITGTLSDQSDLQSALDAKVPVTRTVNGNALSSNVTISTISGNAGTATALQTARAINGVSFDGTAAITVTAAAGTLSGSTLASGVTASSLTSFGSSPTLTTPTIASLANANHNHTNSAGGGQLSISAFSSTTGSGAIVGATSPTLTTPTISKLANLTSNGFVKTSGGDGTLSVDTSTYATTAQGAFASLPGSCTTGALYAFTDSPYTFARCSATDTWSYWFGGGMATLPSACNAWVNQGTATLDTTKGGQNIIAVTTAGSYNMRVRTCGSAPATPYTVSAAFTAVQPTGNYPAFGLAWRQSSDGKLVVFGIQGDNTWQLWRMDSPTAWSAYENNLGSQPVHWSTVVWLRIKDDGTNRTYYYSNDGQHWTQIPVTVTRTTFMTADQIGWYVNPLDSGASPKWDSTVTLLSFKVE